MTQTFSRRLPLLAIGALAASLAAGSIAPALALDGIDRAGVSDVNFRHHFHRNLPNRGLPEGYRDDAVRFADENVSAFEADASCAARFKSYDPASGTYLGYDGAYHPCA